jgi:hypothetical protein
MCNNPILLESCEISGPRDGEHEDDSFLEHSTV